MIKEREDKGLGERMVLKSFLFNYRIILHSLIGIKLYEVFFGRPPREPLCFLKNENLARNKMNFPKIKEKQDTTKKQVDRKKGAVENIFNTGDLIRICLINCSFTEPIKVTKVYKTSVRTTDNRVWLPKRCSYYDLLGREECCSESVVG